MDLFNYNEMDFTKEDVEKGYMSDFIEFLNKMTLGSKNLYNEIHIAYDGYCFMVTWAPHYTEVDGSFQSAFVKASDCDNE